MQNLFLRRKVVRKRGAKAVYIYWQVCRNVVGEDGKRRLKTVIHIGPKPEIEAADARKKLRGTGVSLRELRDVKGLIITD